MNKECTLIATLPSLHIEQKVLNVFRNSCVSEVRFNTGSSSHMDISSTLSYLKELSKKYSKKLWIDIKGRQLRIIKWADPLYECIELNHNIELLYPAKIYFRNGNSSNITHTRGNKVFVDPLPKEALGAGQSVNIIARDLDIKGYLTPSDEEYLRECQKLGIKNIMASFVEKPDDLNEIFRIIPDANIISKIESINGLNFIAANNVLNLMAARDDLYIETGQNYEMLKHLKMIINKDPNAICASRIFTSLDKGKQVEFSDYEDLELMYNLGYRRFMLCDNVCNYQFDKATNAWGEFING